MENDDDEEEEGPTNVVRFGTVFLASLVAFLFFVLDDLDDLVLEDVLDELEEGGVVLLLKKVSMGRPDEEGDGAVAVAVVLEGRLGLELLSLLFLLAVGDLEVAVVSSSFTAFSAITCAFYAHLRARGFSQDVLRRAFERAPSYDQRPEILSKIKSSFDADAAPLTQDSNTPSLVFSPVFSRAVFVAGLSKAIF